MNLTAITFLSNIGTFLLYGLTNLVALVAFRRVARAHTIKHVAVPLLGMMANLAMLLAVLYLGILGGGDTQTAALISILATGAWFVAGAAYFVINTRARSREVWAVRQAGSA
jgi:basic amino acid/polyamine antiporter, APA family